MNYLYGAALTLTTGASVTTVLQHVAGCTEFMVGVPSFTSGVDLITIQMRVYGTSTWRDMYVEDGPSTHIVKAEITTGISNAFVPVKGLCQEIRLKVQTPTTASSHEFEIIFRRPT